MLFDYDLTVPAGTPKDTPAKAVCKLTSGLLNEIRVSFPPGPATLVHVTIQDALHQILPVNPDGDINLDDSLIVATGLAYPLQSPYEIYIVGWSPFAIYQHIITCQFDVQSDKQDALQSFAALLTVTDRKNKRV